MRVLLTAVGSALVVVGACGTVAGVLAQSTFTQPGAIRTSGQSIDVPGCGTLVIELATARVDAGRWAKLPLVEQRNVLTITPSGATQVPWLVGAADRLDIEAQLLGSRYCLAEAAPSGWSVSTIAIEDRDLDVNIDGVPGLWAEVRDGQSAELPVPDAPTTLVVTGDDASRLATVELAGEVEFEVREDGARIALLGGIATMVVGLVLLGISIAGLRRKGRHEGHLPPAAGVGLGGGP